MVSKTGRHATLAIISLAQLAPGQYAGATEIAEKIGAPKNYLSKLLKQMAARGILESQKGYGGGFRLARESGSVSLYDIVEPIDNVDRWNGCFLGRAKCSDRTPCAVHNQWSSIRDSYLKFLKETTVADLADIPAKIS